MKKIISLFVVVLMLASVSCKQKQTVVEPPLMQTSADSMSYVIGLNLGRNLMGLDSLLNIKAVCEGVRDAYLSEPKLNDEVARAAYLVITFFSYIMYTSSIKF